LLASIWCFNPRARGGRDKAIITPEYSFKRFNPRARGGRDSVGYELDLEQWQFQSTRPRGARQIVVQKQSFLSCFNPRARGGRDPCQLILAHTPI